MIARFVYSVLGGFIKNRRVLAAVYKAICIILAAGLCAYAIWNALRDGRGMIGIAIAAAVIFLALAYVILTKKTDTLHAFPATVRAFDTHGGNREVIDATGEHVMRVVFDNGCEVTLDFRDGVYSASLKNDEWDSVDTEETEDENALPEIMERLTAKAAEYVPAEPFEYDEEANEKEEDSENDGDVDDSDDVDADSSGDRRIYTAPGDDGAVL